MMPSYHLKTKYQLKDIIRKLIKERGEYADLNDIDTSQITDMSYMFYKSKFNRDISYWDISRVKDMDKIFKKSPLENNPPVWYKKELL